MPSITIDHVNLVTTCLDATVRFYEEALGLVSGAYPPGLSRGAWLYDTGGRPIIHMQEVTPENYADFAATVRPRRGSAGPLPDYLELKGSGAVDHVALNSDDYDGLRTRLDRLGLPYQTNEIASAGINQVFVTDPNGILIEVNCRAPA